MKKQVLLALSGGVDSAAAVCILQEQGFEVMGATMDTGFGNAAAEAAEVAERLGIKHHIADVREDFEREVIGDFIGSYAAARTPNPCICCNPAVKFAFLRRLADELGIEHIATGHYARIAEMQGRFAVRRAAQTAKDQSYMLYRLPQDILSRLLLPLGEYDKESVRALVRERGLSVGDKPDSQDICFIPDGDYRAFLREKGLEFQPGDFVDAEGKRLGTHSGLQCYTIGQRKRLGIALGRPVFVCELDAEHNRVVLGDEEQLLSLGCKLEDFFMQGMSEGETPLACEVKLRYRSVPVGAALLHTENDGFALRFDKPQAAVTPGQSAVLYDGDMVLGGGIIASVQKI